MTSYFLRALSDHFASCVDPVSSNIKDEPHPHSHTIICRSKQNECCCETRSIRLKSGLVFMAKGEAFQQNYTSFV